MDAHRHRLAGFTVFEPVVYEVADQLFQLLAIAADREFAGRLEVEQFEPFAIGRIMRRAFGELGQVERGVGQVVFHGLDS